MSYHISSDQLHNPIVKELLGKLKSYFDSIQSEFYVIGATARDITLSAIHQLEIKRATGDLDIAIAIPDWGQFDKISSDLTAMGEFHKSTKQKQLFWYKRDFKLDIVPFGEVAKEDNSIYWPPEEEFAMSVVGFTEIVKDVISVIIDDEIEINIASLPGIFVLKLAAFNDRGNEENKHADDIAYIIANYLDINIDRAVQDHYSDLYEIENFTSFIAGAILLGKDTKKILSENSDALNYFIDILQKEIEAEEESILINQILDTHSTLKYDEIFEALQGLLNELR
jgi:predicted nucleotidyltransferase